MRPNPPPRAAGIDVRRILIGTRGAPGRELIRGCRARGIETVAAFSGADADTPYVDEADFDAYLGDGPAEAAWSAAVRMVEVAMDAGCDAIHPGRSPAAGMVELYRAAAAANVAVVGPDPRRAAEALDGARMMSRARAAGLRVPPAEVLDPGADGIEAAARVGVPLWVVPARGGPARRVEGFDALDAARPDGPAVLVHEVSGSSALDVVLVGDRDGIVPLGVVAADGPLAVYPAEDGAELVAPAVRIAREVGLMGVGTVRFRVAADGSPWWWAFEPRRPAAAALVEAVQGIDLLQAELAVAAGQRLGWGGGAAAGPGRHGVAAFVSRAGAGEVSGLTLPPPAPGIRVAAAVEPGTVLPDGAEEVVVEVASVGGTAGEARARLAEALAAIRIDGVPTDLARLRERASSP